MKKVISYALLGLLMLGSCRRSLNVNDYIKYVHEEKNGLRKVVQIDGWEYSLQYKPYDYIFCMESGNNNTGREKRIKSLKGTAWFNISFRRIDGSITPLKYNISSLDEYDARLDYFLNRATKNIKLIYGADTLPPMSYLFENNYNLAPQETMVVGFDLPGTPAQPEKDMQLCYYDPVLKNGIIKALYKEEDLKRIPKLN